MAENNEEDKEKSKGQSIQDVGNAVDTGRQIAEKIGSGGEGAGGAEAGGVGAGAAGAETAGGAAGTAGAAGAEAAGAGAAVGAGAAAGGAGAGAGTGAVGGGAAGIAGGPFAPATVPAGAGAGAAGGAAAGAAGGTAAGAGASAATKAAASGASRESLPEKASKAGLMVVIGGGVAVVFMFIFGLVVIFGPVLRLFGEGSTASASEILVVTKTPKPSHINKGDAGESKTVQYSFHIQNKGTTPIDNVKLVDVFSGKYAKTDVSDTDSCSTNIGQIAANNSFTFQCVVTINKINDDWALYDTATVTGSQQSSQSGAQTTSNLDYYIPFRDRAVQVINEDQVKADVANDSNWPDNFVYTDCGYGVTCWDYIKQSALARGVNPAFVLAVWIAESGASYNQGGYSGHLSCPNGGVGLLHTVVALRDSVDCFLNGEGPSSAFKGAANYSPDQFGTMLNDFCDPATPEICQVPPAPPKKFLTTLKDKYNQLVPAGSYGALTAASGGSGAVVTGIPVETIVSAIVFIGNVPFTDPSGWPTSGTITQTPYCPYDPDTCPSHSNLSAVDIGANLGTPVYATHSGTVTSGSVLLEDYNHDNVIDDKDLAICRTKPPYGCTGNYVVITGANYTTIYMHLESINTACVPESGSSQIAQGALIGFVDSTGYSTGNHLHYEIRRNNGGEVPIDTLSSLMPDWSVSSVQSSYSGGGCGQ